MERELGSSSKGRKSSLFMSGMGVPGGQGTFALEGFTTDRGGQLCSSLSPFEPPEYSIDAWKVEVCNGGGAAKDTH